MLPFLPLLLISGAAPEFRGKWKKRRKMDSLLIRTISGLSLWWWRMVPSSVFGKWFLTFVGSSLSILPFLKIFLCFPLFQIISYSTDCIAQCRNKKAILLYVTKLKWQELVFYYFIIILLQFVYWKLILLASGGLRQLF